MIDWNNLLPRLDLSPRVDTLRPLPENNEEVPQLILDLDSIEYSDYYPWGSEWNPDFYSDGGATEATNRLIVTSMPTSSMDPINKFYIKRHAQGIDMADGRVSIRTTRDEVSPRSGIAHKDEMVVWSYGGFLENEGNTPGPLTREQASIWESSTPEGRERQGRTAQRIRDIRNRLREINVADVANWPEYSRLQAEVQTLEARANTPSLVEGIFPNDLLLLGEGGTFFNMGEEIQTFSKLNFDYYAFSTVAPYVKDVYTANSQVYDAAQDAQSGLPMVEVAEISPVYNFYKQDYEEAIASPGVPEAILPNLYIYGLLDNRLHSPNPDVENAVNRRISDQWNSRQNQIENGFDKVVTLDEFEWNIFPRLGSESFLTYLTAYAGSVPNVAVDTSSELAQELRDIGTPGTDIDLYNRYYSLRTSFPMFVVVDVPTLAMQSFGAALIGSATSTNFINSLLITSPMTPVLPVNSTGFDLPAGPSTDVYISSFLPLTDKTINRATEVYDFDEWAENLAEAIRMTVLSEGDERAGRCPDPMTEAMINNVINLAREEGNKYFLSYGDLLRGKRMCTSETIIYKLRKIDLTKDEEEAEIQNFYFPNVRLDDVVQYVDTQVKYNKPYRYELYGYSIVYGSNITLAATRGNFDLSPEGSVFIDVMASSTPNIKVVEYPIFARGWLEAGLGGVCYPDVIITDRPPIAPEVQVYPFRTDYQKVMMNFQAGIGSYIGEEALEYIPITDQDVVIMNAEARRQRRLINHELPAGKMEFRNEGIAEIQEIEIFRTINIEESPSSQRDLYRSFSNSLHKILRMVDDQEELDTLAENPEDSRNGLTEYVQGFDLQDRIALNTPYYYTFRSVDRHGKVSNPSPIFRVELQYDRGLYIPYIDVYDPPFPDPRSPMTKFDRFIEIGASSLQTEVFEEYDEEGNLTGYNTGVLGNDEPDHRYSNNEYIIRITSRDTGRKIDLKIDFNESFRVVDT